MEEKTGCWIEDIEDKDVPRPDFVRREWVSLDGEWEFSFDRPVFDRKINVPYCYQAKESGIGETESHEVVWYRKEFILEEEVPGEKCLLLKFGAVDDEAFVYVNGSLACRHAGGYVPFEADITKLVHKGENVITLRVLDDEDAAKPRGKQTWTGRKFGCWYTPVTGIWQRVWLEYAGRPYIRQIKITPDLEHDLALCEVFLSESGKVSLCASFRLLPAMGEGQEGGEEERQEEKLFLGKQEFFGDKGYGKCILSLPDLDVCQDRLTWAPEHPNLIWAEVSAGNDKVETYFGMRSVEFKNGKFLLNGSCYYQRLVLDQGYWTDTLLTPPDGEALRKDILLAKAMGFNGARKHQKIEDPRYYYWADRLGFLVWGEMPSCYRYDYRTVERSAKTLMAFIRRDYNHPSIITWVTANESWGLKNVRTHIRHQSFSNMLAYLAKSLDSTRPVSSNDGWEQTEHTDILAIHDYGLMPETLEKYGDMERVLKEGVCHRPLLAYGQEYRGQPVMVTEYGGIAFAADEDGWGYYDKVSGEEEFLKRVEPVTEFLIRSGKFAGFCYTQLTDVMQEVNGLLRENREPKIDVKKLREVFGKRG